MAFVAILRLLGAGAVRTKAATGLGKLGSMGDLGAEAARMLRGGVKMEIEADVGAVYAMLNKVQQRIVPRSEVRALNLTAKKIVTDSVSEASKALRVKARLVRGRFRIRSARLRQSVKQAWVTVVLRPIPAIYLGGTKKDPRRATQTKRGVRAGRLSIPHAFITAPRDAPENVHVFKRTGNFKEVQGKTKMLKKETIDVVRVEVKPVAEPIIDANVLHKGRAHFKRFFLHELRYRLAKHGAR